MSHFKGKSRGLSQGIDYDADHHHHHHLRDNDNDNLFLNSFQNSIVRHFAEMILSPEGPRNRFIAIGIALFSLAVLQFLSLFVSLYLLSICLSAYLPV